MQPRENTQQESDHVTRWSCTPRGWSPSRPPSSAARWTSAIRPRGGNASIVLQRFHGNAYILQDRKMRCKSVAISIQSVPIVNAGILQELVAISIQSVPIVSADIFNSFSHSCRDFQIYSPPGRIKDTFGKKKDRGLQRSQPSTSFRQARSACRSS